MAPYLERRRGTGATAILLRGAPVLSVQSVTVGAALLDSGAYYVDDNAGTLELDRAAYGPVTVEYMAGYDEVPGDVEDAVLEHAHTLVDVEAYVQQETGGSTSAAYAKEATVGVTAKWAAAVAKYNLQARS